MDEDEFSSEMNLLNNTEAVASHSSKSAETKGKVKIECDRNYTVDVKPVPLPAVRPDLVDVNSIHRSPAINWTTGNWQDGSRKSAFQPYRPTTLLTNLQRGNIQTQTPVSDKEEISFHERAGMGEITDVDIKEENDFDSPDENGLTPLMWAASYGQLSTVQLLVAHGARIDATNDENATALLLAASSGHHEIVKLLLQKNATVNHADDVGNTALMYAAHGNHPHCVNELLMNGADFTITNENGDSAYAIVIQSNSNLAQAVIENYLLNLLS